MVKAPNLFLQDPCSIPQQTFFFSFPRETRFKWGSIYGQKMGVHQEIKPRQNINSLLQRMRNDWLQSDHDYQKKVEQNKRKSMTVKSTDRHDNKDSKAQSDKIVKRLFYIKKKVNPPVYDRFGIRSEEIDDDRFRVTKVSLKGIESTQRGSEESKTARQRFMSTGNRKDLNRPLNFYPGPGHYQIKGYFRDGKKTPRFK